jgi:hypothetical protein
MGIMCQIARAEVRDPVGGGAEVCTISGYVSMRVTRCVVLQVLERGYRPFSARIGAGYSGCCMWTSEKSTSRTFVNTFLTDTDRRTDRSGTQRWVALEGGNRIVHAHPRLGASAPDVHLRPKPGRVVKRPRF